MPKIVRFHTTGSADVLKLEDLPTPEPKKGEVLLKVEAGDLNRAEVLFREGQYLETPNLPSGLGYEAAGVVEAVGAGISDIHVGDKVSTIPAFSMREYGMYGESVVVPAHAIAVYPENLSVLEGAAIWMQYLTAYGALYEFGQMKSLDYVLITAAVVWALLLFSSLRLLGRSLLPQLEALPKNSCFLIAELTMSSSQTKRICHLG